MNDLAKVALPDVIPLNTFLQSKGVDVENVKGQIMYCAWKIWRHWSQIKVREEAGEKKVVVQGKTWGNLELLLRQIYTSQGPEATEIRRYLHRYFVIGEYSSTTSIFI